MIELDFVIELDGGVAAIEVKSGRSREAPSIRKAGMFPGIVRRIIFEDANISVDGDGLEHYPIFACAFVGSMETNNG